MNVKPFKQAVQSLSDTVQKLLLSVPLVVQSSATEVRLRRGRPVIIHTTSESYFLLTSGGVTQNEEADIYYIHNHEMEDCFRVLCEYSIHSYEKEIQQGYITIEGGHRAGICGTAILNTYSITGMKDIGSINLRIARQVDDVAAPLMMKLNNKVDSMLIIGPPASGKTTLLKDIIKQVASDRENHHTVAVIDSRGEIAAVYKGVPQNNLGVSTDILDGYPKGTGMMIAIRTLSPDVIVCDEIGGKEDAQAIAESINTGVRVIATAHAGSIEEILRRQHIVELLKLRAFAYIVVLDSKKNVCKIKDIVKVGEIDDENYGYDFNCTNNLSGRNVYVNRADE